MHLIARQRGQEEGMKDLPCAAVMVTTDNEERT